MLMHPCVHRSGPCTLSETGRCVGRWPGGYGPNEDCAIVVATGGAVGGVLGECPVFDITNGDHVTRPDEVCLHSDAACQHSYADCPAGTMLAAGQSSAWHSNYAGQGGSGGYHNGQWQSGNGLPFNGDSSPGGGWQICFT